jgi:hypothetical protein
MSDKICSICGYPLKHYFYKADPVKEGVCCKGCFDCKVYPARQAKIREWEAEKKIQFDAVDISELRTLKLTSECPSGKICYETKVDAEYALYNARKLNRTEKSAYFCKLCHKFHLTSHDNLPTWRDRNRPTNFNYSRPAKYIPVARQENWENDGET